MTRQYWDMAEELDAKYKKIEVLEREAEEKAGELFDHLLDVLDSIDCSEFPIWEYAKRADLEFEHYGIRPFSRKDYFEACESIRQAKKVVANDYEKTVVMVRGPFETTVKLTSADWHAESFGAYSAEFPALWLDYTAAQIQEELSKKKAAADIEERNALEQLEIARKAQQEESERALYEKLKAKYEGVDGD